MSTCTGECRLCPHCTQAVYRGLTSAVAIGVVMGALVPMLCVMLMTYLGGGK